MASMRDEALESILGEIVGYDPDWAYDPYAEDEEAARRERQGTAVISYTHDDSIPEGLRGKIRPGETYATNAYEQRTGDIGGRGTAGSGATPPTSPAPFQTGGAGSGGSGSGTGSSGSARRQSTGFSYGNAPEYLSRYDETIRTLAEQILGRDAFSFDLSSDPSYAAYKGQYGRLGKRAMQDTMGEAAARTGGLASSYATQAAAGAYGNQMAQLSAKIPELYQAAYAMYGDEGKRMLDELSLYRNLEGDDYTRYQGELGQYNKDRSAAYDEWRANVSDEQFAAQMAAKEREAAAQREADAKAASDKTAQTWAMFEAEQAASAENARQKHDYELSTLSEKAKNDEAMARLKAQLETGGGMAGSVGGDSSSTLPPYMQRLWEQTGSMDALNEALAAMIDDEGVPLEEAIGVAEQIERYLSANGRL